MGDRFAAGSPATAAPGPDGANPGPIPGPVGRCSGSGGAGRPLGSSGILSAPRPGGSVSVAVHVIPATASAAQSESSRC